MSNIKDVRSKGTSITLNDGVERELKFTLNALAELEDHYGSVDIAFGMLEKGSIKAVRFAIWAGLLHTEEGLTEQQVGNLIDVTCMENIMGSINAAASNDMPSKDTAAIPNA